MKSRDASNRANLLKRALSNRCQPLGETLSPYTCLDPQSGQYPTVVRHAQDLPCSSKSAVHELHADLATLDVDNPNGILRSFSTKLELHAACWTS